jgi:DNA replication and repair protein RecF
LIRFGADAARVALEGARGDSKVSLAVTLSATDAKRAVLNGARLAAAEQLRREIATLVFTPDRLSIVKGGPAARRAYFDRVLGRLQPARAPLAAEYGGAVAQRNAALRRASAGFSSRDAITPWTERVVALGSELVSSREETIVALEPGFRERAGDLGLPEAALVYEGEPPTVTELESRLDRDLERGTTGLGPHLHDVRLVSGTRDLRGFGSQGEQRLTVLSLLLAEAELISERRGITPLLLLDDVLSELDPSRRRALAAIIGGLGQTVITATEASAWPEPPAQLLEITPGEVTVA